jgi:methionine aminotransferase
MSALAREHKAINLSQGFPDFQADPRLINLVARYMRKGMNQYAPMQGVLALRERVAEMVQSTYGAVYDPETEITITSGATEALFCAITALVNEGDEVIIIEPAYDSYVPAIELSGGMPVSVSLRHPDYAINWEDVKKLIKSGTRAIILNTPHNPTGSILKESDLKELEKIISSSNIVVISDEVYEHIIFDGNSHQSVARFPKLAERSIIISSFGKTLHMTGWKVGYCLAPAALTKEFRKVHQYVNFSTSTPFQHAIADYLEDPEPIFGLSAFYQEKRDLFLKYMEGTRFTPIPSRGTFFQLMGYENISDQKDVDFARRLTIDHKVASIPVSVFYRTLEDHKVLRFCFAKSAETLEKAAEKLHKV